MEFIFSGIVRKKFRYINVIKTSEEKNSVKNKIVALLNNVIKAGNRISVIVTGAQWPVDATVLAASKKDASNVYLIHLHRSGMGASKHEYAIVLQNGLDSFSEIRKTMEMPDINNQDEVDAFNTGLGVFDFYDTYNDKMPTKQLGEYIAVTMENGTQYTHPLDARVFAIGKNAKGNNMYFARFPNTNYPGNRIDALSQHSQAVLVKQELNSQNESMFKQVSAVVNMPFINSLHGDLNVYNAKLEKEIDALFAHRMTDVLSLQYLEDPLNTVLEAEKIVSQ